MPRSGWVKPATDRRLSDLVLIGLLTRVFPQDAIDEAIGDAGRREIRTRILPARVMAWGWHGLMDTLWTIIRSRVLRSGGLNWSLQAAPLVSHLACAIGVTCVDGC